MTNQEFFNNSYNYHVIQRKPLGIDGGGKCRYDLGCAIGCQIPDDLKKYVVENRQVQYQPGEVLSFFEGVDTEFMGQMQMAHDMAADSGRAYRGVEKRYRSVAKAYKLTVPTIRATL